MKRSKTYLLISIVVITITNVVLFLNSNSGSTNFLKLKEKADSLLLYNKFEEATSIYEIIYSKFPNKIDIEATQTLIETKISEDYELEALHKQVITYENLIQSLKEKSTLSQQEFKKVLDAYHIKRQNNLKNNKLDSVFSELIQQEIKEIKRANKIDITTNEMLELTTQEGLDVVYLGNVKNKRAEGHGYAIFAKKGFYEGQWSNNKRNGHGIYYWQNGDRYEGQYVEGNRQGYGTYYFNSGEIYMGEWKNNLRNGLGKMTNKKNKIIYDGLWKDNETVSKH